MSIFYYQIYKAQLTHGNMANMHGQLKHTAKYVTNQSIFHPQAYILIVWIYILLVKICQKMENSE